MEMPAGQRSIPGRNRCSAAFQADQDGSYASESRSYLQRGSNVKIVDWAILGVVVGASIFSAIRLAHGEWNRTTAHKQSERGARCEEYPPTPPAPRPDHIDPVIQTERLIWTHESVGGTQMSGDGGLAQGYQQHHQATWNDALEMLGLRDDPDWQWPGATRDLWRCYVVTIAHWQRYCPEALKSADVELLVRTHRLPTLPYRKDNNKYLELVLRGEN